MSEQMKIEYTNPANGMDTLTSLSFDLTKYRKDDSMLASEDYFLTTNANGVYLTQEINSTILSIVSANPFNPFGDPNIPSSLVASIPGSDVLTLKDNPETLGFSEGSAVAILGKADESPIGIFIIDSLDGAAKTLTFPNGSNLSSLNIKENFIAVQLSIPKAICPKFDTDNTTWGGKSVYEKPDVPTIDANWIAGAPGHINISIYGAVIPGTDPVQYFAINPVVTKVNVYVFKSGTDDFNPLAPVLYGNRKPDAIFQVGDLADKTITTYGGGTTSGGDALANGQTYFVVAVARDGNDTMRINSSYLSNVVTISS